MSAEDYIEEARTEADGGIIGGILALLVMGSCANTPRQINSDKQPEKAPVKIEHRENISTNQFYQVNQVYQVYIK